MEWNQGDLVWFDPGGLGHPLPGEIQEVHQAAQIIVVQAVINGKVNIMGVLNLPKILCFSTTHESSLDRLLRVSWIVEEQQVPPSNN